MSKHHEAMKESFAQLDLEHAKFKSGNSSAGTRARKHLMDIKKTADSLRKEIQETKNTDK